MPLQHPDPSVRLDLDRLDRLARATVVGPPPITKHEVVALTARARRLPVLESLARKLAVENRRPVNLTAAEVGELDQLLFAESVTGVAP